MNENVVAPPSLRFRDRLPRERALANQVYPWDGEGHWLLSPVEPLTPAQYAQLNPIERIRQARMEWGDPEERTFPGCVLGDVAVPEEVFALHAGLPAPPQAEIIPFPQPAETDPWSAWLDRNA